MLSLYRGQRRVLFLFAMLPRQQLCLSIQPAGVSGQAAVRAQYAVAGYDDRDGVMSHRAADGLCAAGHIERVRQRAIAFLI